MLSNQTIERDKLMLLGITCLYLAIKFEETDTDRPHMKYILDYAKQTRCLETNVTVRDVLLMELVIIKEMQFNLRVISPWHILESMLALYGGLTYGDIQVRFHLPFFCFVFNIFVLFLYKLLGVA